jgi:hypothetical protein
LLRNSNFAASTRTNEKTWVGEGITLDAAVRRAILAFDEDPSLYKGPLK